MKYLPFSIVNTDCLPKACTDVERDFSAVEIGKTDCHRYSLEAKKKLLRCSHHKTD